MRPDRLRIVVAGMVAGVPHHGGASWAVLAWVDGFRRLGHDVLLVEQVDHIGPESLGYLDAAVGRDRAVLVTPDHRTSGMPFDEVAEWCGSADVLVNLAGTLRDPELRDRPTWRAYVDLDPGFTQVWHEQGCDVGLVGHDAWFTVGLAVGGPGWSLPTCGVDWVPVLPPAAVGVWRPQPRPPQDSWTTVAHWRGYGGAEHEGLVLGQRAHSWRGLLDLPGRTTEPLEPALAIHPDETDDVRALARHGWRHVDPADVAATPDGYRRFVSSSRGELGIAKHGYVASGSGWFSDRSACYLAAGRPVVAQDTGWSAFLPTGLGLVPFDGAAEAAEALAAIAADHARHATGARELASSLFASDRVAASLLAASTGSTSRSIASA